ncbi:hypothetical protein N7475_005554 [Penicillium sp. IBT 31633x]|nr:hypothetical protein N7475_005554 [Penicillium sp. IBT 31633x]
MPHEALDYGVRTDQSYLNRTDSCSILRHRQDEVSRIVHVEELGSSFTKLILCELGPISSSNPLPKFRDGAIFFGMPLWKMETKNVAKKYDVHDKHLMPVV